MDEIQAVVIDTGDPEETLIQTVHLLRGTIITQFSHVEFMFADLFFRALRRTEYRSLPATMPYRVKERIARVKQLAAMDGPISTYAPELFKVVDVLVEFENLRQYMAHGNMTVEFNSNPPTVFFQVYDKPKGSGPVLRIMQTGLDDLTEQSIRVGLYANEVVSLFYRIYTEIPLNPVVSP